MGRAVRLVEGQGVAVRERCGEALTVEVTLGEGETLALPEVAAVAVARGVAETEAVEEGVSVAVPELEGVLCRLGEGVREKVRVRDYV